MIGRVHGPALSRKSSNPVIPRSVAWASGPPMETKVPGVGVAQTPGLGLRSVLHEPRTEKRGPRYPDNNDFRGSAATRNLLFGEQGADSSLRSD
jgi:hypothetical protein